ncbi:MAG: transglutaminase family protein [Alphaproteobacteria bacterium]
MRIRLGCELSYEFLNPTPMIATLNVHPSRAADLERRDNLTTAPNVPLHTYRDAFGNDCTRLVAPPGKLVMRTDGIVRVDGNTDPVAFDAIQHQVQDLPDDTIQFLLGSRYCETDRLTEDAWRLFGNTPLGWARVQAVCDYVHGRLTFGYQHSRATRTAHEAYSEKLGVCRDYAHLAIALCRCLNIPARYCTGYISDIGLPPPYEPQDFAAWIEVYLGGQWHVFDPRNNAPRRGRVLIARGRDAADVPLTHTFGPNTLVGFKVWMEEVVGGA